MSLRSIISKQLFNIAILWDLTSFYGGSFVEPFFGVPVFLFGRLVYAYSKDLFYILYILITVLIFLSSVVALKILSQERFYKIVSPKILGLCVGLAFIKVNFITLIFLISIFNFLYNFTWKLFQKHSLTNEFLSFFFDVSFFWETILKLFLVSICAGIEVNIIYHVFYILSFVF